MGAKGLAYAGRAGNGPSLNSKDPLPIDNIELDTAIGQHGIRESHMFLQ